MDSVWANTLPVFYVFYVLMMGGAAFMTGQAVAGTWRPLWQVFFYSFLLGLTDRFLTWGLFQGQLLSILGFVVDTIVITGICLFAYRITRVSKMVTQYPWLYERAGPLSYRKKLSSGDKA